MTTVVLDPREQVALQPAHALWAQYQPENAPYRFRAGTPDEVQQWQAATRAALASTVGFQDRPAVPLAPRQIEVVDKGDYIREKVLLHTAPETVMPVYLLLPKGADAPRPVVLAFAGHGYGVKDIVGLWEDGEERNTPDGYHKDFAVALCRRGFAVAAPEISCFGERQTDFSYLNTTLGQGVPTTCTHTAMLAFHLGGSAVGLRVRDGKRLVDYLQTRSDVDAGRLGAMGISGGGLHTFFSTCLDPRIQACVISGYYSTFRDSVLAMSHCACNFVPGLGQFGEMYDLVGLIAPRPLLVEAGTRDPIFPIEAVKRSVDRAREVYGVWGAEKEIETDYFEGRHQISGRRAYDFLWEKIAC
ncbi:MAG: dienelactone hydrolase family protein [Anaerolineae bacterium]|jgi:dienelactone hydrolase